MSEGLLVRVKRIVSGNIHDVVDRMEKSQAEIVMKEALREIERAIEDVRSEQGKSHLKSKQAEKQIELLNRKILELIEKTQFAIDQDRDDLAKAAIARQVDFEAQIPVIKSVQIDAIDEQAKLAECVAALTGRKREMIEEIKSLAQARNSAEELGLPSGANKITPMQRAENATNAFQRAGNGVSSVVGIGSEDAAKIAELERLKFNQLIHERLLAAKQLKKTA
jgi:phage shock protein A